MGQNLNASGAIASMDGDYTQEDRLRLLLESIASLASASGIRVKAHRPEAFAHYRALPNASKREILSSCESYYRICASTVDSGRPLTDTNALLWASLKYFEMAPTSDLMDFVTDDLAVELYDRDGRQVFRNFKFMEVCSYTLADVLVYPWWELFRRNDDVLATVMKEVGHVLAGDVTSTIMSQTLAHRTGEVFSERRHELDMKFRWFSPVFDRTTKAPVGFVCGSEVHVLDLSNFVSQTDGPSLRIVPPVLES